MKTCCCQLAGTSACKTCQNNNLEVGTYDFQPYFNTIPYNKIIVPNDKNVNSEIIVEAKLGCKECGHSQWFVIRLPESFTDWKCKNCGDSTWLPMLIEIKKSDLPTLKPIRQVIQDEIDFNLEG